MDVTLYRGDDAILAITIQDETGAALDLSGAAVVFVVVIKATGEAVITKMTEDGIEIVDAANGQVEITLTHDDTDIESGEYALALRVVSADDYRYTAAVGTFKINTNPAL